MTLDAKLRPVAKRLLETYGKASTLTRVTGGTYDPVTGQTTDPTETDYTVYASPPKFFRRDAVDGEIIRETDFYVTIAAQGLAVTPDRETDTFTFDGADYTILRVEPQYSGELVAAYKLHLRV